MLTAEPEPAPGGALADTGQRWRRAPGAGGSYGIARIFMYDPQLLRHLPRAAAAEVRRKALVKAVWLRPGAVRSPLLRLGPDAVGYFVLEGFLVHRVRTAGSWSSEVIGPRDLILPSRGKPPDAPHEEVEWRARAHTLLGILDRRITEGAVTQPGVLPELFARASARTRRLRKQLALARLPRMDARLHALLWVLARDFGEVRPGGARVVLPVTQETLAELVGGRRQAVNTALHRLRKDGRLVTAPGGLWLLRGAEPEIPE